MLTEISPFVVFKLAKVLELLHTTLMFIKQQYLDFGTVKLTLVRQTTAPNVVDQESRPAPYIDANDSDGAET